MSFNHVGTKATTVAHQLGTPLRKEGMVCRFMLNNAFKQFWASLGIVCIW